MKVSTKKFLFFTAILILALLLAIAGFILFKKLVSGISVDTYSQYPSLQPEIRHTVAIRFDPSFYYRGEHPKKLAVQLARQWKNAGVNLVFYRAYDPFYGAFYRTHYELNREGEFGKYNLLKYVLKECHTRDIRVFAWLPVLNHYGAWRAQPEWRMKEVDGSDFSGPGLEYPLCARIPEAREWWYKFIKNLLQSYPEIDGIDLAEPVVSWRKGDACFCDSCREAYESKSAQATPEEIRAQPLTTVLKEGIALAHTAGKQAAVTFVVPAASSGDILSLEQMRDNTGFDLSGLLHAEEHEIPDIICPEFIWQQLKSIYSEDSAISSLFSPEWTVQAVRSFLRKIDMPVGVLIHLEITDFPGVEVDSASFERSLQAAVVNNALGIDVYSSSQLDRKNAWPAIKRFKTEAKKKHCLVLYDPTSNRSDAIHTGELLRHFKTEVSLQPLISYVPGTIHNYDAVFYVGTESGTEIPKSLIRDISQLDTTFCWLGFNIDSLLDQEPLSAKLGIHYRGIIQDKYRSVSYKNTTLIKEDPWTNVISIADEKRTRVLATASDGKEHIPYAVRSGRNFWFFADIPTSYTIEGDRFLVFADLLHDILNEDHVEKKLAMVRIEDVHPLTSPEVLKKIARYLHGHNIPFQVAFVPFYIFPEENINVSLNERPKLISALKYMVKKGGTLVLHGVTHQRYGETTTDYEFWDSVSDSPIDGQTKSEIRQRIERGIRECWLNGLYPLIWETPHYAGSQELYSVISDIFSISMERRQSIDERDTDQFLPYAILPDRFNQIILPENLGYVPLDNPQAGVITEPAKKIQVVRDGVASFFFHPFIEMEVLKSIIRTMKKDGFTFTNASGFPVQVKTSFGILKSQPGTIRLSPKYHRGKETLLLFPGILSSQDDAIVEPGSEYSKEINIRKGELFAIHFIKPPEEISTKLPQSRDLQDIEVTQVLQGVSNHMGEPSQVPLPLIVEDASATGASRKEMKSFESTFKLVGIHVEKKDVKEFSHIGSEFNLLVLPSSSASSLNASQLEIILESVRNGDTALITSGFSPLTDKLGIEKMSQQVDVHSIADTYYPDVEISWETSSTVTAFESPEDAEFIYIDRKTETPLVITSPFGQGRYIFLATPLDEKSTLGSKRYPYFLSHVFRCLQFFPLVRARNVEVFFNPGDREEIAIEDLVKLWRRSGVRIIHAAAWQVFPEWTYDYKRLIHLAHTNAMLVYAWLEPPYVHEKFWLKHPEWREKNPDGEDAVAGWRKPMALGDPEILRAVLEEWRSLLERFDWDGVMINRLGFETGEEEEYFKSYTPFHPRVREHFFKEAGFDPIKLFDTESDYYRDKNPAALQKYEQFRNLLAKRYAESLLDMLQELMASGRNYWELILTYDSRRINSAMNLQTLLEFKQKYSAKLQLIPSRDNQWESPGDEFEVIQLVISPSQDDSVFHPLAPTTYPTGSGFYHLLQKYNRAAKRFTIFSENSLYDIDTQMVPLLLASGTTRFWDRKGLFIESPSSGEIVFSEKSLESLTIDGAPAGSFHRNRLILPVGKHYITPVTSSWNSSNNHSASARLVDSSVDLLRSEIMKRGIKIDYRTDQRAILVINEKPIRIYLQSRQLKAKPEKGLRGWAVTLPPGEQSVVIITRSALGTILTSFSLTLSNAIVVTSILAIIVFLLIFTVTRLQAKFNPKE